MEAGGERSLGCFLGFGLGSWADDGVVVSWGGRSRFVGRGWRCFSFEFVELRCLKDI